MKTYRVNFSYTEIGVTIVKANSEEEAENKVYEHLAEKGLDDMEYKLQDREYITSNGEALNE